MGNICNALCNEKILKGIEKGNPENSQIQYKINQELKRESGQFFNEEKNKDQESIAEKPSRSKENIEHLYNIQKRPIGEGGFGIVLKAQLKGDSDPNRYFAIKIIDKKKANKKDLSIFLKEIELLKLIDHPYLVNFHEVYEDSKKFYIVLEYLEGGELMNKLEYNPKGLSEAVAKKYFWQMAYAVHYLHCRKIVHRDLKPENFMFKKRDGDELKLIDFGLAQSFSKKDKMKTICGSPYYLAPEILNQKYTKKCDVWSLGVMLFELLTGELPFFSDNNNELFRIMQTGRYDKSLIMDNPKNFSEECKELLERMIVVGEKSRFDLTQVLEHNWFNQEILEMRTQGKNLVTKEMLQNLLNFSVSSLLQREILGLMVQAFQGAEEIEVLKKIFMAIDVDFSGTIQKEEIYELFIEKGMEQTEERIEDIVDTLYLKEKGIITFLEFEAGLLNPKFFVEQHRLETFFNYLDLDGNGFIEFGEILDCFKRFGRCFEEKIVRMMIREVDNNSDGKIDFDEFSKLMGIDAMTERDKSAKSLH